MGTSPSPTPMRKSCDFLYELRIECVQSVGAVDLRMVRFHDSMGILPSLSMLSIIAASIFRHKSRVETDDLAKASPKRY